MTAIGVEYCKEVNAEGIYVYIYVCRKICDVTLLMYNLIV